MVLNLHEFLLSNTKEDITMEVNGRQLPTFFKISSVMFKRRKKISHQNIDGRNNNYSLIVYILKCQAAFIIHIFLLLLLLQSVHKSYIFNSYETIVKCYQQNCISNFTPRPGLPWPHS